MTDDASWSGDTPMEGTFFIGSIHPPHWYDEYDPNLRERDGYVLSPQQLAHLQQGVQASPVPVTIEHEAVMNHKAIGRAVIRNGVIDTDLVTTEQALEQIFEIARHNPAADVVGQVTDMFTVPDGPTYAELFMPKSFDALEWLITQGGKDGLSLTHGKYPDSTLDEKVVPYEVTFCNEPARPLCRIIYASSRSDIAPEEYKRQLQRGDIRDPYWSEHQDKRIMAAAAQVVAQAETQVTTPQSQLETALKTVTNAEDRRVITASLKAFLDSKEKAEKELIETREREKTLKKELENAQRTGRHMACSVAVYRKELTNLSKKIDPELAALHGITEEDVKTTFSDDNSENYTDQLALANRMVMACNIEFMRRDAAKFMVPVDRPNKRPAVQADDVDEQRVFAASNAALHSSSSSARAQHPGSSDDASALMQAEQAILSMRHSAPLFATPGSTWN